MPEVKKEDTTLQVTITVDGFEIEKVLCRVYLPVKVTDPIELRFYPTREQAQMLEHSFAWRFSVRGEVKDFSGEVSERIFAETVYSDGITTQHWGPDLSETLMIGTPADLRVTNLVTGGGNFHDENYVEGSFWLTPSLLLRPAKIIENHYTGEVKVTTARQFTFTLPTGVELTFDHHFRRRKGDDGDSVTFSELVAGFKIEDASNDTAKIQETLYQLDDVLLLASFAARQRCICLGWDSVDSNSRVKQFIRNRTIPKTKEHDRDDVIIDLAEFREFMKTAHNNFTSISPNTSLRRAINFVIPKEGGTVDSNYVMLYAALEMLVLQFRREKDLEFIFPKKKQWKKIRDEIKESLEKLPSLDGDTVKRQMVVDKISELNRISFATAFESFCADYSVNVQDLWPVVGNTDGPSLSLIRNKLVHGESFDDKHYGPLFTAQMHLQWTVERMILAVLKWPVEKSNLNPRYLSHMVAYNEWEPQRASLSR